MTMTHFLTQDPTVFLIKNNIFKQKQEAGLWVIISHFEFLKHGIKILFIDWWHALLKFLCPQWVPQPFVFHPHGRVQFSLQPCKVGLAGPDHKWEHREGIWFVHIHTRIRAFLGSQMVKNLPAAQDTLIQSLEQEYPLKKGMAIYSSILT